MLGFNSTSLREILADLDLSPSNGSMINKRVKDKAVQRTGSVSMRGMHGNVCGSQMILNMTPFSSGESRWVKRRDETSVHTYLNRAGGAQLVGDSHYNLTITEGGAGGDDRGTEGRLLGQISTGGTYKLTGTAIGRFDTTYSRQIEIHCAVVANTTDYLVGPQILVENYIDAPNTTQKSYTWNFYMVLNPTYRYITVVMRAIAKDGGAPGRSYTHDFFDTKLVRES